MGSRFKIVRRSTDRLEIELNGELSENTVRACEAEVRAQLSAAREAALKASIDLRGVTGYTLEARAALVALQRFVGTKATQTAFLAVTAASRGLALWVMHMSENQVIKSFADNDDANAWFAGQVGPTTGVRPVTRAGERKTPSSQRNKIAG
jgi:hypothetical protein